MDELLILIALVLIAAIIAAIILPIIALVIAVRSKRRLTEKIARLEAATGQVGPGALPGPGFTSFGALLQQLNARVATLEASLQSGPPLTPEFTDEYRQPAIDQTQERRGPESLPPVDGPPQAPPSIPAPPPIGSEAQPPRVSSVTAKGPGRTIHADQLESIIGRRWLGWVAVILILFAAAFFLKYAFDNRWIGELGRVAIGVTAGVGMTAMGFKYYRRGWRVFSQILTAGGVVLLYLSVYGAFGYYHLATQKAAFAFLAILVAEAAGLALLYDAPAIAIMALVGGFLTPLLLRSDRDQYRSLFGYILALDIGALALLKHWYGLSSLAFTGTHLLFWLWYGDNYHPAKLVGVMVFQTAVFLIFLLAHAGRQLVRRQVVTWENLGLLLINPFVFFATAYHLLNPHHHDWMGIFAIGMALLYAGAAKILLDRAASTRSESLSLIGIALTFVTIAIPIQLRANWITIAWAVEALVMLWAGLETRSKRLRALALVLFGLALFRLLFWDTPGPWRPIFTPVLNKYFLASLVVSACLFGAALVYEKVAPRQQITAPRLRLVMLLVAIMTVWWVMSVETYTFFAARAMAQKLAEDASHERWLGQMALSVLWAAYAAVLAAFGFLRRSAGLRWTALALFALTVIKAMLVDIARLQQLYRIIVFFVLGVLLLVVAWGYHRAFHSRESST